MSETKPFKISKRLVWDAYKRVKANRGAPGIDAETIAEFDKNLSRNLYKIWNRLSSGSYFPPAVKVVKIPKKCGGERHLGIPTISDRIAQTAVVLFLEPQLETVFHDDSYGYRKAKSAHDAIAITRKRCWRYNWVLEYDIKGLFDNIRHDLLMKALSLHCKEPWVLMCVQRWLEAPKQYAGQKPGQATTVGTPQGGPLSPLLANLFLHYCLDHWLATHYPLLCFCRYADDGIIHCRTQREATQIWAALEARLQACGLEMNQSKSSIVFCRNSATPAWKSVKTSFDFLGYTFRPRRKIWSGKPSIGFLPAISQQSMKSIRAVLRNRRFQLKSSLSIEDLARSLAPAVRGWINYYCKFRPSEFQMIATHLDGLITRWAMRKFRRLRGRKTRAYAWLDRIRKQSPALFVHWTGCGRFCAGVMGAQ